MQFYSPVIIYLLEEGLYTKKIGYFKMNRKWQITSYKGNIKILKMRISGETLSSKSTFMQTKTPWSRYSNTQNINSSLVSFKPRKNLCPRQPRAKTLSARGLKPSSLRELPQQWGQIIQRLKPVPVPVDTYSKQFSKALIFQIMPSKNKAQLYLKEQKILSTQLFKMCSAGLLPRFTRCAVKQIEFTTNREVNQ